MCTYILVYFSRLKGIGGDSALIALGVTTHEFCRTAQRSNLAAIAMASPQATPTRRAAVGGSRPIKARWGEDSPEVTSFGWAGRAGARAGGFGPMPDGSVGNENSTRKGGRQAWWGRRDGGPGVRLALMAAWWSARSATVESECVTLRP